MDSINSNIKVETEEIQEEALAPQNGFGGFLKIKSDADLMEKPTIKSLIKVNKSQTYLIKDNNDPEKLLKELPVKPERQKRRRIAPKKHSDDFLYDFDKKKGLELGTAEQKVEIAPAKKTFTIKPKPVSRNYLISGPLAEDLRTAGFISVLKFQNISTEVVRTQYPTNFEVFNSMVERFKQAWMSRQINNGVNTQFQQLRNGDHEFQTGLKNIKKKAKEPELKPKPKPKPEASSSSEESQAVKKPPAPKSSVPTITIVNPQKIVDNESSPPGSATKSLTDPEKPKQRGRKRKVQPDQETEPDNSLEEEPPKCMSTQPCPESCVLNCSKKISEEARKELFDHFWTLTTYEKRLYCADRVKEIEKNNNTRRSYANKVYHLESMGIWYRVCKFFFCSTLGYQNIDQLLKVKRKTGTLDPLEG